MFVLEDKTWNKLVYIMRLNLHKSCVEFNQIHS